MPSRLDEYINHIGIAGNSGAWYAALALSLALPEICGAIEYRTEQRSWKRYGDWCTSFVTPRDINLSGADLWVLRCSFLHRGTAEIQEQPAYEHARLGRVSLTQSSRVSATGVRKMTIPISTSPDPPRSRYALPVGDLCEQIVGGAGAWQTSIQADGGKVAELSKLLVIRPQTFSPA